MAQAEASTTFRLGLARSLGSILLAPSPSQKQTQMYAMFGGLLEGRWGDSSFMKGNRGGLGVSRAAPGPQSGAFLCAAGARLRCFSLVDDAGLGYGLGQPLSALAWPGPLGVGPWALRASRPHPGLCHGPGQASAASPATSCLGVRKAVSAWPPWGTCLWGDTGSGSPPPPGAKTGSTTSSPPYHTPSSGSSPTAWRKYSASSSSSPWRLGPSASGGAPGSSASLSPSAPARDLFMPARLFFLQERGSGQPQPGAYPPATCRLACHATDLWASWRSRLRCTFWACWSRLWALSRSFSSLAARMAWSSSSVLCTEWGDV